MPDPHLTPQSISSFPVQDMQQQIAALLQQIQHPTVTTTQQEQYQLLEQLQRLQSMQSQAFPSSMMTYPFAYSFPVTQAPTPLAGAYVGPMSNPLISTYPSQTGPLNLSHLGNLLNPSLQTVQSTAQPRVAPPVIPMPSSESQLSAPSGDLWSSDNLKR